MKRLLIVGLLTLVGSSVIASSKPKLRPRIRTSTSRTATMPTIKGLAQQQQYAKSTTSGMAWAQQMLRQASQATSPEETIPLQLLSIGIYTPTQAKKPIDDIKKFALHIGTQYSLDSNVLVIQPDASYWIALMYLQQVGSAVALKEKMKDKKDEAELDDIISFNYANEHMPADKKEIYLQGLINAIEYIINRDTNSTSGWKVFLSTSKALKQRPTIDITSDGIAIDSAMATSLDEINDEYPKLAIVKVALEKELKELLKDEKKVEKKEQKVNDLIEQQKQIEAKKELEEERYRGMQLVPYQGKPEEVIQKRIKEQQHKAKKSATGQEQLFTTQKPPVVPVSVLIKVPQQTVTDQKPAPKKEEQTVPESKKLELNPEAKKEQEQQQALPAPTTQPEIQEQSATTVTTMPEAVTSVPGAQSGVATDQLPAAGLPPILYEQLPQQNSDKWLKLGAQYEQKASQAHTSVEVQKVLDDLQDKQELYPELIKRLQEKRDQFKSEESKKEQAKRLILTPEGEEFIEREQQKPERWLQQVMEEEKKKSDQLGMQQLRKLLAQKLQQEQAAVKPTLPPEITPESTSSSVVVPSSPTPIQLAAPVTVPTVTPAVSAPSANVLPTPAQIMEATKPSKPVRQPNIALPLTGPRKPATPAVVATPPAPSPVTAPVMPLSPTVPTTVALVVQPTVPNMPLAVPVAENDITALERAVVRLEEISLPIIKEKSKANDTVEVAKVFLQQSMDAYTLYAQYQPRMNRQAILIELRDFIIFFKQLKAAYKRASSSSDPIAAAYFEAVEKAADEGTQGILQKWWHGSLLSTKEAHDVHARLRTQFKTDIEEAARFARLFKDAALKGMLRPVWEFVTSMHIAIRGLIDATDKERQDAIKSLTRLKDFVYKNNNNYDKALDDELTHAAGILIRSSKDKEMYKAFIHPDDNVPIYDDIQRTIIILQERLSGGKPLTLAEQYITAIDHAVRDKDPSVVTTLQEASQLPPEEKKEVIETFKKLLPEKQEEVTQLVQQQVQTAIASGNLEAANQLVQQIEQVLPAQKQAIESQVRPIIAKAQVAQRQEIKPVPASTAEVVPALQQLQVPSQTEPIRPRESVQGPVIQLQAPPISAEEKEFLRALTKPTGTPIPLTNETIERVLNLFMRAVKLNDEESIRLAVFAMKKVIDNIKKLKPRELASFNAALIEQLRKLWEEQAQAQAIAYLAGSEQFIALTERDKRLKELEDIMNYGPTVQQLRAMVPELQMMIKLGARNKPAQAISQRAQALYDRVMNRLKAFTSWR